MAFIYLRLAILINVKKYRVICNNNLSRVKKDWTWDQCVRQ